MPRPADTYGTQSVEICFWEKQEHIAKLAVKGLFAGDTEASVDEQNCQYNGLCNKTLQLHNEHVAMVQTKQWGTRVSRRNIVWQRLSFLEINFILSAGG